MHKPFLDPLGLTFPQYLVTLELLGDAPVTVGALGARLGMDTGTITPLLKRLEAAGIVTRTRDIRDERRVIVDLAPRGRAMQADVEAVTDKIKSACRLDDKAIGSLTRTLEELAQGSVNGKPQS